MRLRLAGESPLRYFDAAPAISISSGGRVLHRFTPTADFDEVIQVPAEAVSGAPASIAIDTDRVYVPAERSESADRRRLGLRVLRLELTD